MEKTDLDIKAFRKSILGEHEETGGMTKEFRTPSEYEQERKELKKRAYIDPITNLPNSWTLLDFLKDLDARRKRCLRDKKEPPFGVIIALDLDRLKFVNDTYGHNGGDYYLRAVAKASGKVLKKGYDKVFRLGEQSDEFSVCISNVHNDKIIEEIMDRVDNKLKSSEKEAQEKYPGIKFSVSQVAVKYGISASASYAKQLAHNEMKKAKDYLEKSTNERGGHVKQRIII